MAIHVHKAGLLDTIQDAGRYGYQHWGINPGGAMDMTAMRVANMLVGNDPDEAVIEMHIPAATIFFEETALIALAGADIIAMVNDMEIPVYQPVLVAVGSVLRFLQQRSGCRIYFAVHGGMQTDEWLGSHATHLKVKTGGWKGRSLQKDDRIPLRRTIPYKVDGACKVFPWKADHTELYVQQVFSFIAGAEYNWLDDESRRQIETASFIIGRNSDRMGFRLQGAALHTTMAIEMISTAVTRGAIQLLPDGQLIILMADHQTTGGYPRIGHITTAAISSLSQMPPGAEIKFAMTSIAGAEAMLLQQERNLQQLQNACTLRLDAFLTTLDQ